MFDIFIAEVVGKEVKNNAKTRNFTMGIVYLILTDIAHADIGLNCPHLPEG